MWGRVLRPFSMAICMSWPTLAWSIVANGGRPQGLLLHDFEFRLAGQEAAGVVARHAERGLREFIGLQCCGKQTTSVITSTS